MAGRFPSSRPDWSNIDIIHRGVLSPRSYFFLYENEASALTGSQDQSRSIYLSGVWKFQHSVNPFEAPQQFENSTYDTSKWKDIQVPGHWQLQGWGNPHYSNINYIIPANPPNVPFDSNETGSYVRKFSVPTDFAGEQLRLRFEGVDSAFHVYVNGFMVGYSQGSRNPAEFDITSIVNFAEENVVAVRVYQFCDGTYLEDQDQWRMSGIFRDVLILAFPKNHISDFQVQTLLDDDFKNADLVVKVATKGQGLIGLKLLDSRGATVATKSEQASNLSTTLTIAITEPKKWSAEEPYLYKLVLSFGGRFIVQNVGFRKVEIKDVLRGVNRHEHHPVHGRAVPYDFLKNDLLLMKKYNINAIRTAHQPPDPRLFSLADELGFWVIDEADLECHGFCAIDKLTLSEEEKNLPYAEKQALIYTRPGRFTTDNPDWKDQHVDRAVQLCMRDKNHPSVVIWSLGNESFYGRNIKSMYDAIRAIDTTRPIHYEGDRLGETVDLLSKMYLSIEELISFGEEPNFTKPLILCEYIHAMGNGPGNIKEYIDAFYAYPRLQGGCAWEWANHGLDVKGSLVHGQSYAYGGDFKEEPNDYNFILDGMCFSDHTPTPGLIEYKKAIEPVQLQSFADGKLTIANRYDLVTLDHLNCDGFLVADGYKNPLGEIPIPTGIAPHTTAEIALPELDAVGVKGEIYLQLNFSLKEATAWADSSHLLSSSQLQLRAPTKGASTAVTTDIPAPTLDITPTTLTIVAAESTWVFSLTSGKLTSWIKSKIELFHSHLGPEFDINRAETDNDRRHDAVDWKEKFVHLSKAYTHSVEWFTNALTSSVEVIVETRLAPLVLSWSINIITKYTFRGDGSLNIHCSGNPAGENLPLTLPRIGFTLGLPQQFDKVEWFGRGPGESYKDKKLSQLYGNWTSTVDELFVNYEFPQEGSNRTDVRWVKLDSGEASLKAMFGTQDGFSFMASHYTWKDLYESKHPHDLREKKKDYIVLRLDPDHHGLGSGSCGPKTREEYALKPRSFEFEIRLE
ncbi:hypothetical protein B0O99DRAFT_650853 [Bisporella sp. PMI_857]|nr:hypothetical protein B0O99DRAFT_650853 [Bisporella sp. PMI_857]